MRAGKLASSEGVEQIRERGCPRFGQRTGRSCLSVQLQMGEYLLNHFGIFDAGNDLHGTACGVRIVIPARDWRLQSVQCREICSLLDAAKSTQQNTGVTEYKRGFAAKRGWHNLLIFSENTQGHEPDGRSFRSCHGAIHFHAPSKHEGAVVPLFIDPEVDDILSCECPFIGDSDLKLRPDNLSGVKTAFGTKRPPD